MTKTKPKQIAAPIKHIVFFSGGAASWAAAKRIAECHGAENTILFFTDTRMEDADLYRFLWEGAAKLGIEVQYYADGRTPWQVFRDERMLGNSMFDPCSKLLKREPSKRWIKQNFKPDECILYVGIDYSEKHRLGQIQANWSPYRVEAPLCAVKDMFIKEQVFTEIALAGMARPRLYDLDFSHNNCGGFCVKAGIGHFMNLLDKLPEVYAYHEQQEQEFREWIGKDVSILKRSRQVKGVKTTTRLTLRDLRLEIEAGRKDAEEAIDIGGCNCFGETAVAANYI